MDYFLYIIVILWLAEKKNLVSMGCTMDVLYNCILSQSVKNIGYADRSLT